MSNRLVERNIRIIVSAVVALLLLFPSVCFAAGSDKTGTDAAALGKDPIFGAAVTICVVVSFALIICYITGAVSIDELINQEAASPDKDTSVDAQES